MTNLLIVKISVLLLSISNIGLLVVMLKITDKINLHHKLISEILDNLCDALGKEDAEEE